MGGEFEILMKSHGDATYDLVGVSAASDYAYPLDVANLGPKNLTKSAIPVSECQDITCFPCWSTGTCECCTSGKRSILRALKHVSIQHYPSHEGLKPLGGWRVFPLLLPCSWRRNGRLARQT